MTYRLGLDIGSNSIGWCCLSLGPDGEPSGLLDIGVRVYPDGRNPKDLSSLAAARRGPRAMRRNRDRYLRRRRNLLNALTRFGLMPSDNDERTKIAALDPYQLRADALSRRLEPFEIGRVLFHLNQRRGFKSNRKTDRSGDNESGLIKTAAHELSMLLAKDGHNTIGQFLAARHMKREGVRVRLAGSGKSASYPFYPLREMIESEFDAIWSFQATFDPRLTPDRKRCLKEIIFYQRPLKQPAVGRCWLEPSEARAYRAMPTAQAFRIAQDLAHLRLSLPGSPDRALTDDERSALFGELIKGKSLQFDKIRKKLHLPADTDFNLASLRREELVGAPTAQKLAIKKILGPDWNARSLAEQDAVVDALVSAQTDDETIERLTQLGLDAEAANRAASVALPEGTASLSLKAMRNILPHLMAGQRYDEAVKAAGYAHHSDLRTGEIRERLPYYGELLFERIGTGTGYSHDPDERRWGRAPNPTVHVALNELRRVVNAIVDRHGSPAQIVVETLRDLGRSAAQRREIEREQRKNQIANDARKAMLAELGLPPSTRNLIRLRLWEEQGKDPLERKCPYTGTLITARMALSDEIEEDHILPYAVSLDDSAANRVLVTRAANREKARRTPFEAFGHSSQWADIQANVQSLPGNKKWRFAPDALKKLAENGDFLARHLTDSATIARLARLYLDVLAPGNVWSTPGRLTALLRAKLGLNSDAILGRGGPIKDRTDHRHHAIDAVVVALTDRSLLQRVSTAAARAQDASDRLIADLGEPWPGLVADVARSANAISTSHKPDTGWQGALHNDTAYGLLNTDGATGKRKKGHNVVVRRTIASFADLSAQTRARRRIKDLRWSPKPGHAAKLGSP